MKIFGIASKAEVVVLEGQPEKLKRKLAKMILPLTSGKESLSEDEETKKLGEVRAAMDVHIVYEEISKEQLEQLKKLSVGIHTAPTKSIKLFVEKRYDSKYSSFALDATWSQLKDTIAVVSRQMAFKAPRAKRIETAWSLAELIFGKLETATFLLLPYSLKRVMIELKKASKPKSEPIAETAPAEETKVEAVAEKVAA